MVVQRKKVKNPACLFAKFVGGGRERGGVLLSIPPLLSVKSIIICVFKNSVL